MLKPEVDSSLEKYIVRNGLIKLYCVWYNMVALNKAHAKILVCAADVFRKYQKMQKLRFFLRKNHKKSFISMVFFKLA